MPENNVELSVSLIVTVKNEAAAIGRLLDSISAQVRLPDEVVIADGGSRDQTVAAIEAWGARQSFPVHVLSVLGANISQGRNAAIRAAAGPVIASTDAGVRLDPLWLAKLLEPYAEQKAFQPERTLKLPDASDSLRPQAVSGFFVPDPQNAFEMAMSATVLPTIDDIDGQTFLPSSRSIAFTKEAWEAVGGYPEWLDYCEDLLFDFALRDRYGFVFAPDAVVKFRPRGSLSSFIRQYYLYARGDGKADLWRLRHAARYATYLVGIPLLAGLYYRGDWFFASGLLLLGAIYYTRIPYLHLLEYLDRLSFAQAAYAVMFVPVIRFLGDIAKMMGYPVGVWWRLRRGKAAHDVGQINGD